MAEEKLKPFIVIYRDYDTYSGYDGQCVRHDLLYAKSFEQAKLIVSGRGRPDGTDVHVRVVEPGEIWTETIPDKN